LIYLHGFASSARSSKAAWLAARCAERGVRLVTPDFNEPDFEGLTITRMLRQVDDTIRSLPPGPVALIGSSLGGFVAVQAALRHGGRVERLVLLAPALDFSGNRLRDLGDRGVDEWRRTGTLNVFHYGFGRIMPVSYALYEDTARYDSMDAALDIPVQIFQGRRDTAVDPATVKQWADARPSAELHLLDDDHQLMASLEYMWREMTRFLWGTAARV
jgi:pimeloyl-ACP methyl ester carboxylesterase